MPFSGPTMLSSDELAYVGRSGHGTAVFTLDVSQQHRASGKPAEVAGSAGAVKVVASASTGALVFARKQGRGAPTRGTSLWLYRPGRSSPTPIRTKNFRTASLMPSSFSSDGGSLAVSLEVGGIFDAGLLSLATSRIRVVAHDATEPAVSPDGRAIAFIAFRRRDGVEAVGHESRSYGELYVSDRDGGHLRRLSNTRTLHEAAPAWSSDGKRIAYTRSARPEPLSFGFTNSVIEINANGTCPTPLLRWSRGHVGTYGPSWFLGRQALGPIRCRPT